MNTNQQKLHTYAKNTHQKFTLMFYLHFEQKNNQNLMMKKKILIIYCKCALSIKNVIK